MIRRVKLIDAANFEAEVAHFRWGREVDPIMGR